MKIIKSLTVIIGILVIALTVSYKKQPQKMYSIYTKLTGNISFNNLAWIFVSTGINVSAASIDIRYKKNSVPNEGIKESLSATAWRGERVNAQLVIWTTNDLKQVHCISSDLRDTNGNSISSNNIKSFFVRYVMTDVFGGGCGHRKAAKFDSSLVADILDPIPYFDIEKKTTRPVWITVDVPHNAVPGNYFGKIIVYAKNQKEKVIQLHLKVQDKILPEPSQWDYHLDLWQNPFAVARYHQVEKWSDNHFELLRPLMEMLANTGQKCITTSIMLRPWGGRLLIILNHS